MKKNVLIVEDHELTRFGLKTTFEDVDYVGEMYEASSAEDALEIFTNNPIDVVIMDLGLPTMNGIEATQAIRDIDKDAKITIATSKTQVSSIYNQIGRDVGVSIEPCRRDTFPAIALATSYLHDVQGIDENEAVVVCPVDPYVEPTYPSEKYGYIIPNSKDDISYVKEFKEKPDIETARKYIENGALWNGGVFAYKLKYVLDRAHELIDFTDYEDLFDKYETLTKISFDYAVVEKEPEILVKRFKGEWKDLGTWNTLTEAMEETSIGKAILNDTCKNVHVVNELGVPVVCMGLTDVVVSASAQGILVSDKEQSSYIKPYVDGIDEQIMFAEKSWGSFKVIDVDDSSMTIKVTLNAGNKMNYHSHDLRNEIWNVISGEGTAIIDGMETPVKAGDVITMEAGCKHTIIAKTNLNLIEVQVGSEINAEDKHKFELEYK